MGFQQGKDAALGFMSLKKKRELALGSNVAFHCAKGSKYLKPNEPVFAWHICEQL